MTAPKALVLVNLFADLSGVFRIFFSIGKGRFFDFEVFVSEKSLSKIKKKSVDARLVAHLAEISGFHFSAQRAELLVPQLEWLLSESQKIAEADRTGLEPVHFFVPAAFNKRPERDDR